MALVIFLLIVIAFIIWRWEGRAARQPSAEAHAAIAKLMRAASLELQAESKAHKERMDAANVEYQKSRAEGKALYAEFEASTRAWVKAHAADPQCEALIQSMGYNLTEARLKETLLT